MPFTFTETKLKGVILIEPKVFGDDRGFFVEEYKKSEFIAAGITEEFIQDNHSKSTKGVLRGLHYQLAPSAQAKIVKCPRGRILDVAVDIRKNSETFGKWVSYELSEENKRMLYIPAGFAHGFVVLSDEAELTYKVSAEYAPHSDRGIRWNDPDINVEWGIDIEPLVSEKDYKQPFLKDVKKEDLP